MIAGKERDDGPELRGLLLKHFAAADHIGEAQALAGGFFSRAYAVAIDSREYVVRLNSEPHAAESFAKDAYAWRHFNSASLPIPRIIVIGRTPEVHYAISERAAGRSLMACSLEERQAALPALLDALESVGRSDVMSSSGSGDWGSDGNGKFENWRGYLASVIEDHDEGYYKDWHRLFEDSFLERDVYEAVYDRMLELLARCPEQRSLIHNDFQFENLLWDGRRITGVIDWANALYGDSLYDVAWLSWLSVHPEGWFDDGARILTDRFSGAAGFAGRLACYQLHIGLDHLRFYARNDQRANYQMCRDWLVGLISGATG